MAANRRLILNRYRPIAQAGSGGFGTVQVAWDTRIQRKVAIKCIELDESQAARVAQLDPAPAPGPLTSTPDTAPAPPATPSADFPWDDEQPVDFGVGTLEDIAPEDEEEDFEHTLSHVPGLDEARTAAMLSDASIVAVYDLEVQGTTAYLIMEYVEGITLAKLLRDHDEELDLDIVAAVFSNVAHALQVAHDNQVLHLDIKPDNILINLQGQVKVTDFGLATLVDASGHGRAGGGTIGYMPPEQMRQEELDGRCDEWALASVTYEMLAGRNPFLAPTLARAQTAIQDAELVLPSLCWEELDAAADDVLFYALDPDRDERYESVADFADELEPFLGDARRGARELAGIVGDARLDDDDAPSPRLRVPLRDRVSRRMRTVAAHALGGAGSAVLGAVAAANVPAMAGLDNPLFWVLVAACAAAGAVRPHLGALVGYVALGVAFALQGQAMLGAVLMLAVAAWWYFAGRHGLAAGNVALLPVWAGGFGLGPLAPLAAGLCLRPAQALATTAFCVLVAFSLAACGSGTLLGWGLLNNMSLAYAGAVQRTLLGLLQRPDLWVVAASWVLAAFVASVFLLRRTRLFAALGMAAAGAVLVVGVVVAASGSPQALPLVRTAACVALMLLSCALLPDPGRDD